MKLAGRAATRFCQAPDLGLTGALIHGADGGQVAAVRQRLVAALCGGDDLRLTRIEASAARKDAAETADALRARGFFPGRRAVLIEGGTDGLAKPLAVAVDRLTPDDAFLIVTADALPARSGLRRLFEGAPGLVSLQLFADAPEPADIEAALRESGATGAEGDAVQALAGMAASMDHGSFAQLVELLAVHALDRNGPITLADVMALAPAELDAELDALVGAVADGRADAIGPLMRRLEAAGTNVVTTLLALQRHFRMLLNAAAAGGSVEGLRPPLYGPRKAAVQGQLRRWTGLRLEQANQLLLEADAKVRSSAQAPDRAVLERCALRLAMMAGR